MKIKRLPKSPNGHQRINKGFACYKGQRERINIIARKNGMTASRFMNELLQLTREFKEVFEIKD